jgi:glucose/arabinose dehydrogenase
MIPQRILKRAVLLSLAYLLPNAACTQSPPQPQTFESQRHRFRVVTLTDDLEHPWGLAFLPDGRMLVTERPGRLRIVENDGTLSAPLADRTQGGPQLRLARRARLPAARAARAGRRAGACRGATAPGHGPAHPRGGAGA